MSDSSSNDHGGSNSLRAPGILPTREEREIHDRQHREAEEREVDRSRKERETSALENANHLARSNRNLQIAIVALTVVTAGASWYQGWLNKKSWVTAQDALQQMRIDAASSSDTFQAQIHHYDATLGQTQVIAKQTGIQAGQTAELADHTQDLVAQAKTQADASKTIALQSAAQAEATNKLAVAAQQSADNAAKQVAEMQRQIAVSQRAWISILQPKIVNVLQDPSGFPVFSIEIPYKNVGNIPATNTEIFVFITTYSPYEDPPAFIGGPKKEKAICDEMAARAASESLGVARVAIPGEGGKFGMSHQAVTPKGLASGAEEYPLLMGCIMYKFISSPDIHKTGFIYQVAHPNGSSIRVGEKLSVESLDMNDFYNGEAESN